MSLEMLLGPETAATMTKNWPATPFTQNLPDTSPIGRMINAQTMLGFLDAGCAPGNYFNMFYKGEGLHPSRFIVDDRVAPASVQLLLDQGCTIQMRELNRWYPPLGAICAAIQTETGCPSYSTAFITPADTQGLDYHWDQYLGLIAQLQGTKTWELFKPKVDAPHRDHSMSTQIWQDEGVEQWQESGPDMTVELAAGQVLAVPRGWVHNPHARNATETSVHLTFVLKERTPLWAAERLISSSINDPRFRAVIPPADLDPLRMPELVRDVRGLMIDYLTELDIEQMARALRNAAEKETSHTAL